MTLELLLFADYWQEGTENKRVRAKGGKVEKEEEEEEQSICSNNRASALIVLDIYAVIRSKLIAGLLHSRSVYCTKCNNQVFSPHYCIKIHQSNYSLALFMCGHTH